MVAEIAEPLGRATNNVAEWTAVRLALEEARRLGATHVDLRMDSELVARQITGIYRVKHPDLKPIHAAVMDLLAALDGYTVGHVPRELNRDADRLSNVAIDGPDLAARSNRRSNRVEWRVPGGGRMVAGASVERPRPRKVRAP